MLLYHCSIDYTAFTAQHTDIHKGTKSLVITVLGDNVQQVLIFLTAKQSAKCQYATTFAGLSTTVALNDTASSLLKIYTG